MLLVLLVLLVSKTWKSFESSLDSVSLSGGNKYEKTKGINILGLFEF